MVAPMGPLPRLGHYGKHHYETVWQAPLWDSNPHHCYPLAGLLYALYVSPLLLPLLLTGTHKQEHLLISLHWLPVHFRITCRSPLVYCLSPPSLSELLHLIDPPVLFCPVLFSCVPKTKRKLRVNCAFVVVASKLWNDLLLHIRQASS